MKRILVTVIAVAGLSLGVAGQANASWGELGYSGYQPWWNLFAKRYKCITPEEERLQKFWADYYDALRNYYSALGHIDWVAYYKNHGIAVGCGGCGPGGGGNCGRINYYPVTVVPNMQWGVPQGATAGPACPPGGPMMMPPMMPPPGGGMPFAGMPGGPN
jgi:hypothetical protein